ncbi:hypothetical protein J437_LFUL018872 [Ladona fulva]|nr:hypothetical protein J437_LFUL018872 [Ladona fulva]
MVSTRGVKFKFSEGEKVLCYEPDPTKAKVLYDSKVLEVIVNKDSRGRKNVEYLIHFQGWNSSWDRCVGEDYVLKDTEDNRRLQRTLADKAQLQLRERKQQARRRKTSDRTSDGAEESSGGGSRRKRRRLGGGSRGRREEESSGDEDDGTGEGMSSDDDNDDGEDEEEEEDDEEEEDENEGRVPLTLSENLIKLLEEDRDLITCRNKLVKLPASPNAVQILENFMKQYALNQIFPATMSPDKRKSQPRSKHHHHSNGHKSCRPRDFSKTVRSLNLCKEVVDGIRIYFDHTLSGLLLYAQEKEQYEEEVASLASLSSYCRGESRSSNKITPTKITIKQEQINSYEDQPKLHSDFFNTHMEEEPKSSYVDSEKGTSDSMEEMCLKSSFKDREAHSLDKINDEKGNKGCDRHKESDYKDDVFKMSNDIKTDFLTSFPGTFNNTMSSAASTSSCCSTPSCTTTSNRPHSYLTVPNVQERPTSINSIGISASETGILKRIMSWKMIPESSGIINLPSQLYGAIHLVRLFVKLPDLLYAAGIQDKKLKVLLGYLHTFLEYLEEHTDWFGDFHYKDNPSIYT